MRPKQLMDKYGRVHDYLRISVTDRCNLRCIYCMPAEGMKFMPHDQLLTYEEITEVVRVLANLGVTKLRLTGGEPLVRKDLEQLVAMLAAIPGINDIALSTNGILLADKARTLKEAGITRVNISLDSIKPEIFAKMTRGGDVQKVLAGLEASYEVGFSPVKLNVVLMKGFNDGEIADFIRLTLERPIHVRFIEYMPIGHDDDGWRNSYLSLSVVSDRCREMGYELELAETVYGNGPAQYFRVPGSQGTIGLIHPVSDHFCETCNRLRLTSDGNLKPCLYWTDEFNVRKYIGDDQALEQLFFQALESKPLNHEMALALEKKKLSHLPTSRRMSQIGG